MAHSLDVGRENHWKPLSGIDPVSSPDYSGFRGISMVFDEVEEDTFLLTAIVIEPFPDVMLEGFVQKAVSGNETIFPTFTGRSRVWASTISCRQLLITCYQGKRSSNCGRYCFNIISIICIHSFIQIAISAPSESLSLQTTQI